MVMNRLKGLWRKRDEEIVKKIAHIHAQANQNPFFIQNQRLF